MYGNDRDPWGTVEVVPSFYARVINRIQDFLWDVMDHLVEYFGYYFIVGILVGFAIFVALAGPPTNQQETAIETVSVTVNQPEPKPQPKVEDTSCTKGEKATLVSVATDKVSVATKEEPHAWAWETETVFQLEDGTHVVCQFEFLQGEKIMKPGQQYAPVGGKRVM